VHTLQLYFIKIQVSIISAHLFLKLPNDPFLNVFMPEFEHISYLYHTWYMAHPPHPLWVDHSNFVWWTVQIVEHLTMQIFLAPCLFLSPRSKYSAHQTLVKHIQSMFFP
jgi:hypothetical protein